MFTVNHVKDGVETIYQTKTVKFIGENAAFGPGGLAIDNPDSCDANVFRTIRGGKAFVMNADGRTVASYVLPEDTAQFQHGGAANAVGRIGGGFAGGPSPDDARVQRFGIGSVLGG